jgi:hypothetical protein
LANHETGRVLQNRPAIDLIEMINDDELEDWTKKFEQRLAQAEGVRRSSARSDRRGRRAIDAMAWRMNRRLQLVERSALPLDERFDCAWPRIM